MMSIARSLEFHATSELHWDRSVSLRIGSRGADGRISQVAKLEFEPLEEGQYMEPTIRLDRDEAQRLMNELWSVGVRPSSGEGNFGQLGATERHLEDMRRLVFGDAGQV